MRTEAEPPEVPSEYTPRTHPGLCAAGTACGAACGARAEPESRVLSVDRLLLAPFSYDSTMLCWRMRCKRRVALTFLSARVELDEKDESCDALIFWWEH